MGIRILVADDNRFNVKHLKIILENQGFEVFSVDNGLDVLKAVNEYKPEIILLDIMMHGMDGFEVCSALKSEHEFKDIPVVMVTAKTASHDVKTALDLGAFDYIKKPLDEVEVVARIQSALRYKKQQDRLKELATIDGLTGIYNRSLLMELFKKEYSKRARKRGSIVFVMIDIDHFKRINDTYGHTEGDRVLQQLADILSSVVRRGDILGRYGGEEFGLCLSDISESDSCEFCERLRKNIEANEFKLTDNNIHLTVSIGISAQKPSLDSDPEEIIKQADDALYRAKRNGRNRIECC